MSMKKAIEAMCFQCIYDPLDVGSKHQQTDNCTSPDCALYEYRPLTGATRVRLKQERYDALSDAEKQKYDEKANIARERLANSLNK